MIKFEYVKDYSSKDFELPSRATPGSAGYDLCSAEDVYVAPSLRTVPSNKSFVHDIYLVPGPKLGKVVSATPTVFSAGIKIIMPEGVAAIIYPRSSLFKKKGLMLTNSCGVVDSDYQYAENNGEVFFSVLNFSSETILVKKGDKLGQVIFTPYLTVDEAETFDKVRVGGFGSTG